MKRSLLALAVLTALTGVASAQSSVTLFGIVDVNARNQKNGGAGSINSLSTDGNASSRLGFRGVEDLGGGLRAGFHIEGAIAADTGTGTATGGGQNWQRRSTVSLLGGFGEIRLGRDYVPTFWNHTVFDPFGTNGVGSSNNLVVQQGQAGPISSNVGTQVRASNSVGYFLPTMGGLYGQVMVAAGENSVPYNKYAGGRLGYGAGPFNIAGAYGVTETGAGADLKEWNVAGSFKIGDFTLYAFGGKWDRGSVEQEHAFVGGTFAIGAGTIKVTYGKVRGDGAGSGEAEQVAVGYVHDLSRRTAIYAHFAQIDNDVGSRFVTSGSGPTNASLSGWKSTGYEFGVRHSF